MSRQLVWSMTRVVDAEPVALGDDWREVIVPVDVAGEDEFEAVSFGVVSPDEGEIDVDVGVPSCSGWADEHALALRASAKATTELLKVRMRARFTQTS